MSYESDAELRYEDEQQADPFATFMSTHPGLIGSIGVAPDIYKDIFSRFFESEMFERWLHRKNSWQLHCVGGPGCGKVP